MAIVRGTRSPRWYTVTKWRRFCMSAPPTDKAPATPPSEPSYSLDQYVHAATRDNTRRSYRAAIEHYEAKWGGFLPATASQVAQYLVDHAKALAVSTLTQRLAALAAWHNEQGFPDPTKAPLVKKTLKGIRELHPSTPKQAKPLQVEQLRALMAWMTAQFQAAERAANRQQQLLWARNRALVLVGFWRGFRSDELCRMRFEHTEAMPNQGLTIFLPRSKQDRDGLGRTFHAPALTELCPVEAFQRWRALSELETGPVFQGINRWGQLSGRALNPNSLIGLLRQWLSEAGVTDTTKFGSHSLRRGFASWANSQAWDLKALMEYVGWRDVKSAMRYIDAQAPFQNALCPAESIDSQRSNAFIEQLPTPVATRTLNVFLTLERYHQGVRTKKKAQEALERFCLQRYQMRRTPKARHQYTIEVSTLPNERFDDRMAELIQDMHDLAQTHQCVLDVALTDSKTGEIWD